MTGGSFVQRTSSYGSLPGATLPVRKTQKMSQSNSREKERFLAWICKIAGRKGGMLFLVVVSLVFIISLSAVSKDEDVAEIVDPRPFQSITTFGTDDLHMSSHNITFFPGEQDTKSDNNSLSSEILSMSGKNKTQPRSPTVSMPHPCERFAFPPPPTDPKRTGPRPCPVCYVPVEQAITFMPNAPSMSPVLKNLTYVVEEESLVPAQTFGGSTFGGYPTLRQRNDSFNIKESMNVHCGFVKGNKPGHLTGFDIDDADLLDMEKCRGLVVASAVFGNYDEIQQPKNISGTTKRNACFYMFVDEETESFINKSNSLDNTKRIGIWRIVLVRNLPYVDARRNGKVPKLLLHRIFPNARFSIWIDGKLELVVDPYQILERFLWRQNATFAISRHYRRFDVFVEAEANKAAGKYDTAAIDAQIDFYRREGLSHYSPAKLPITSDVPEGCVIIREHIPITNLFTCLWFNEVDRFTSRDQISFSTVRDKILSKVDWSINMFLDCERRNFVIQAYHRDILRKRSAAALAAPAPPPPVLVNTAPETPSSKVEVVSGKVVRSPVKKVPARRGREKKSGSRHHRSRSSIVRDINSF